MGISENDCQSIIGDMRRYRLYEVFRNLGGRDGRQINITRNGLGLQNVAPNRGPTPQVREDKQLGKRQAEPSRCRSYRDMVNRRLTSILVAFAPKYCFPDIP